MMQYSTFIDRKKVGAPDSGMFRWEKRKILLWVVKAMALFLMVYFIGQKVKEGHLTSDQVAQLVVATYRQYSGFSLLIPLLLVVVNWALEARKWQLLAAPVVQLNIWQATRAVLTGLGLGFITPRSVGDYAGRILEAPAEGRERLVGAVLLNRISQSVSTYLFGIAGLLFIFTTTADSYMSEYKWEAVALLLMALAIVVFLWKGRSWLTGLAEKYAGKVLFNLFKILKEYSQQDILVIVGYAFLRYFAFSLQFVLVLWATGIELPLPVLTAGVSVVFLLKSIIPAFNFLSDLGVREFSALWAFSFFAVQESQLITASLLVWCINVLLPTIIGGFNILRLRINRFRC